MNDFVSKPVVPEALLLSKQPLHRPSGDSLLRVRRIEKLPFETMTRWRAAYRHIAARVRPLAVLPLRPSCVNWPSTSVRMLSESSLHLQRLLQRLISIKATRSLSEYFNQVFFLSHDESDEKKSLTGIGRARSRCIGCA